MKKYIPLFILLNFSFSTEYYVSKLGNNDNSGTVSSPFKTIQKAADMVAAGDIVNIMSGVYHETISLDNVSGVDGSPIIFRSYDLDRVVIDGTVPISPDWEVYSNSIWKTNIDFDIWQLFIDRKEQVMARWPNANFDDGSIWDKENHWAHGTMDQSEEPAYENGTLIDDPHGDVDLSAIGFNVENAIAILNVGSFRTWTRKINSHSGSTITYDPVPDNEWKVKHHDYYLEGKLEFLDSEGEWFYDYNNGDLYLWTPMEQNPNELDIRGKVQSYAFNISNSDHIEIQGLEFFGTTFHFENSDFSKVDNCNLWYPSCHKRMLGIVDTQPEMSVFKSSSNCTVSKSAFRYTDGSALEMYSHNNTIEDCYFYHIDYSVTDLNSLMTTIQMGGANNIIRRNTMHKLGASATLNPGDASFITLNNISDTGHMQGDGAMVQVMTGQAPGTEISYNWLHNSIKYGARFDGNGTGNNGMMHHNVMWGLGNSGIMAKGFEFKIFNNTVIDGPDNKNDILVMIEQGGNDGTLTHNNVADRISGHRSGSYEDHPVPGVYSHNINGYEIGRSVREMLIDPDNLNFRPHPDSALVDAGLQIDGITDGYVGAAPDIGAYEYGGDYWIPGITWNITDTFGNEFIEPPAIELNQDTVKWVSTFSDVDEVRSLSPTDDGGSIMISTYTDENSDRFMWLTKLDAYGDTDWTNNLGYFDQATDSYSFEGYDVIQTSNGGYALIGSWLNGTSWERNNIQFVRTDSDGNELDTESWGYSSYGSVGKSIIQTDDGGFVIAAQQENSTIVVFKTDSTLESCNSIFNNCMHDGGGNAEKWGLQISYSSSIVVEEVIQSSDGGYIVLASNMWIGNNHSGIIVKINNIGSIEWQRSYNTAYRTVFYGIDNTHDGGFIVSGYERTSNTGFPYDESLFLKLNGEGDIIWEKTFDTNRNDWPINIKTMEDGTFISAVKYYGEMEETMYSSDIRLVNLDTDGNLLWSFDYTGEFNQDIHANHLFIAPDQNFLIVGRQEDAENSNNYEGLAMKIGTNDIFIPNPEEPEDPGDPEISELDNYSLNFDGLNDHVAFGPNILSGSGDFSVSLWFKSEQVNAPRHIFQKRSSGNSGWLGQYVLQLDPDGKIFVWTYDNNYRWSVRSSDSYDDNNWHHVVIVQDNSINGGRMYVDGIEIGQSSAGVVNLRNDIITYAGGDMRDNIEYFNGKIDEVSIYNVSLSQIQINQIFASSNTVVNNLIGYWKFNEGEGNNAFNEVSDNYHGIIYGCLWSDDVPFIFNSAPTVYDQSVLVLENSFLNIPFNGTDSDGDLLIYSVVNSPSYSSVELIPDTGFAYTPYNNFFGLDSFTYVAFDGEYNSESATVTIEVLEVNDAPQALGGYFVIGEDDTVYSHLEAEDGDYFPTNQDIQQLTYSIALNSQYGDIDLDAATGMFSYTPFPDFFGADSFSFVVTDNGTTAGQDDFLSDTAGINIFVEPINDAPVLSQFPDTSMAEDSSLVLSVYASDIDNAELSIYVYTSEDEVMAYVEDTLLYISTEEDWNGTAEIIVTANDNMSRATDVEQFMLTVTPVNDPPFFTMDDFSITGDMTAGVDTWVHADDIDSDHFFILEGAPSWLMMNGSRMTGQPEQDGVYTFTLSVSDSDYVVSEEFTISIVDHRPDIISFMDVPQDQGRQMKLQWMPGYMDEAGYFTQFSIWRQVPSDTVELWDFIVTVPWLGGEEEYSRVVPTLGDSTSSGIHHSTFRVTAHTEDVDVYHDSEPITGYSIDNLHPSAPQGVMALQEASGVVVHWTSAEEIDFSYHNVYRQDLDSPDPAAVFTTSDSFFVDLDITDGSWQYWVTAVDSSGNESDASDMVSVMLANEQEIAIPTVFSLEQNYPNPFNPSTQVRYALPEASKVSISIYDMMGREIRSLVNQSMNAGYHTALWNATNDNGNPVSAGMYIYTIQAGDFVQTRKMILLK